MDAIYIPQLTNAPERTEVIQFKEFLPNLETLTPVQGQLRVTHQGNYLEVSAQAEAIMTLDCHRCLKHYNHRLAVDTSELIWLDETGGVEATELFDREIGLEDVVESLPPQGYFHPGEWLYEQMCLAIPHRQLCDADCSGIEVATTETVQPLIDRRWASLEALKKQLPS